MVGGGVTGCTSVLVCCILLSRNRTTGKPILSCFLMSVHHGSNGDVEAQNTLVSLLRQERNDAISSLASAKAELEIAREDLENVIRKRRNKSPSPSRGGTSGTPGSSTPLLQHSFHEGSPRSRNIDAAVQKVLNAARQRASAALAMTTAGRNHTSGSSALHRHESHSEQQQYVIGASSPNRHLSDGSPSNSSAAMRRAENDGRRLDDEIATHMDLAHRQIAELERRIERYETDMQTALTRNEELQLRLDASLLRERALSEKVSIMEEESTDNRMQLSEQEAALEALKVETTKLMMKLNVQSERDSQLEAKVEGLEIENRRFADDAARLRGANEAYQHKISDLETDLSAMRVSNDRREEDLRQKVVLLSRELASVREQRDQALRPYHARQSAPAASAASPSSASSTDASRRAALNNSPLAGTYGTLATSIGGGGMASPPASFFRGSPSSAQRNAPASAQLGQSDDVMELKRQVQWLLLQRN